MKVKDGILGFCVGDALGVPAEFQKREVLAKEPIVDMIGYGTHNQPPGTWSDDSSLTLCLLDSLVQSRGVNTTNLAEKFVSWLHEGVWTPHGDVFDIGILTTEAILRLEQEPEAPELAGGDGEYSNGNGSLMRILPLAYYLKNKPFTERKETVKKVSSLTHRHPTSIFACILYMEFAIQLLEGADMQQSYQKTQSIIRAQLANDSELDRFERIVNGDISTLSENEIESTGYVVHTLEAALWSLMTSNSYQEAVLKAVNLGEDNNTIAAVTGGLAGLYFGVAAIPETWLNQLVKLREITALCEEYERMLAEL